MNNRLICFIHEDKLLYDYKFGFKKGNSTYMTTVMLVEINSGALDRGEYVISVFLVFSKAFDTVDQLRWANLLVEGLFIPFLFLCNQDLCIWLIAGKYSIDKHKFRLWATQE